MSESTVDNSIEKLSTAVADGRLSQSAADNIKIWLTDERYENYVDGIQEHIASDKWSELDDVFWTVIPFGTGGRRGKMYPFGCNAINKRTIGESAQGLAEYVTQFKPDGPW